jgi:Raf kinase inhibitor-like YbhB/YbcL family protein
MIRTSIHLPDRFVSTILALGVGIAAPVTAHADMTLTSASIPADGKVPSAQVLNGFGCTGGNVSPALAWSGAPKNTKSFVITLYDPDAPTGSGFWHWSAFNIPAGTTALKAGAALPAGAVAARNDFSWNSYSGPCPPQGTTHRYIFSVYAMPTATLPLDETASAALVGFFAHTGELAHASLTTTMSH